MMSVMVMKVGKMVKVRHDAASVGVVWMMRGMTRDKQVRLRGGTDTAAAPESFTR